MSCIVLDTRSGILNHSTEERRGIHNIHMQFCLPTLQKADGEDI